ncbi:MAG TPA: copper chaperone PCu(A)C [Devosiaceae bacterium]|nr:copper chaperone PCu(A)C [Devosiaceae bacterium]
MSKSGWIAALGALSIMAIGAIAPAQEAGGLAMDVPGGDAMPGTGDLMPVMITFGDLLIENPWTRATPPNAPTAGGYLKITNNGRAADVLTGGATAVAERVEIHEMAMTGGVMTMTRRADGVTIEPGETLILRPGGYHVMMIGLAAPVATGADLPVTLNFAHAGDIEVMFYVTGIGAGDPYSDGMGGSHEMDGMDGIDGGVPAGDGM